MLLLQVQLLPFLFFSPDVRVHRYFPSPLSPFFSLFFLPLLCPNFSFSSSFLPLSSSVFHFSIRSLLLSFSLSVSLSPPYPFPFSILHLCIYLIISSFACPPPIFSLPFPLHHFCLSGLWIWGEPGHISPSASQHMDTRQYRYNPEHYYCTLTLPYNQWARKYYKSLFFFIHPISCHIYTIANNRRMDFFLICWCEWSLSQLCLEAHHSLYILRVWRRSVDAYADGCVCCAGCAVLCCEVVADIPSPQLLLIILVSNIVHKMIPKAKTFNYQAR